MDEELFFVEATEPTNIIWENRHYTPREYFVRSMVAVGAILFLLALSFAGIFSCKLFALEKTMKYPIVDCDDVKEIYGSDTLE
jgi:hypothetical protein